MIVGMSRYECETEVKRQLEEGYIFQGLKIPYDVKSVRASSVLGDSDVITIEINNINDAVHICMDYEGISLHKSLKKLDPEWTEDYVQHLVEFLNTELYLK